MLLHGDINSPVYKSSFIILRDAFLFAFEEERDLASTLVRFVYKSCVLPPDSTDLCSLVSFNTLIDHLNELFSYVVTGIIVIGLIFLDLLEDPLLHFSFSLAILFILI